MTRSCLKGQCRRERCIGRLEFSMENTVVWISALFLSTGDYFSKFHRVSDAMGMWANSPKHLIKALLDEEFPKYCLVVWCSVCFRITVWNWINSLASSFLRPDHARKIKDNRNWYSLLACGSCCWRLLNASGCMSHELAGYRTSLRSIDNF